MVEAISAGSIQDSNPELIHELDSVTNCSKKSSRLALDNYNVKRAIDAWDRIGHLSSDVSSSVLAKQASIICERFREETILEEQIQKKRRMELSSSLPNVELSNHEDNALLPESVRCKIDRMARMSKIMLEIENCHRRLRAEMLAMAEDSDGSDMELP